MTTTVAVDREAKRTALQVSVFGALSACQLEGVAGVSESRHFTAGSALCVQAEWSQEAFVIGRGQVGVIVDGARVASYGPGDLVGDWALFGSGRRSATLLALTDVDAVVVDSRELDFLLMAVPEVANLIGPHPQ